MELTFNLLLTLLIEIPMVGFFFKKRKRRSAYLACLFVNFVSWPLFHIIRLNTSWDITLVTIVLVALEGLGYWFILNVNWKKASLITLAANAASFIITKLVHVEPDMFQKKIDIVR
jgi:hypothetical protein